MLKGVKQITNKNIVHCDFNSLKNKLLDDSLNIKYILPLGIIDYKIIKNHKYYINDGIKILCPDDEIVELFDNKNSFTKFMLNYHPNYIPDIYYLDGIKIKDIKYPAIYKPMYSTSGSGIKIIYGESDLLQLPNYNNIQKFIEDEYEYGAHMLCIDGEIVKYKIMRYKYDKYTIKTANFPKNYENVNDFDISVFKDILKTLQYSGGGRVLISNLKIIE